MVSREVVQPVPSSRGTSALNSALQRLASNSRDATALVDAGFAALEIGDVDAAVGFFSRADAVDPGNARAQAGLGAAYVRSENPYDALLMFEEAERAGAAPAVLAGDRGLAYDLVGDTGSAQTFYRKALALGPNPEVTRRLAVSLAISGDRGGAEAALLPLLQKQDLAAYRARAFVLAISGDAKEAQKIADQVMPRAMASKIAPYLRYMPRLTPAQQAAAANFGQFPAVAQIGKQDPRAAKYASNTTRRPAQVAAAVAPAAAPQSPLVPAGEPFGRKADAEKPAKTTRVNSRARQVAAVSPAQAANGRRARELPPVSAQAAAAPQQAAAAYAPPPTAAARPTGELPAVSQGQATAFAAQSVTQSQPVVQPVPSGAAPVAGMASSQATQPVSRVAPDYPAPSQAAAAGGGRSGDAAIASYGNAPDSTASRTAYGAVLQQQAAPTPGPAATALSAPVPAATAAPAAQPYGPTLQEGTAQVLAAAPPSAVAANPPAAGGAEPAQGYAAPSAPASLPASTPPAAPPAPVNLADAFADFALPTAVQRAPGAVDITRITPRRDEVPAARETAVEAKPPAATTPSAREAPARGAKDTKSATAAKAQKDAKKDAKPKPPAQPSRVWVQVATGRDVGALGFDWRRMTRANADLFKGQKPHVAVWGQSNRLLTGPFPNAAEARVFVNKLKKDGLDSFVFTSSEGEEVKALPAR